MKYQLIGKQIGPYSIQALLGEGGMAQVYKAYHLRLRREVAIKVIYPQSANRADFQARFEREAQLIARLQHRNIVTVYDSGESGGLSYLVMQYVSGGTLRDLQKNHTSLEPRRSALYALQVARALHHAHIHGIVHRDVKPQNILISAQNPLEVLLSDFGLAKIFEHTPTIFSYIPETGDDNDALSRIGEIVGTPRYMAPEQCLGQPVDARTDIYALGVVLFEMLTGQTPFQGPTMQALMYQHVREPAPPVRSINPQVPEPLAAIAERALAKEPAQRYQSAREMGLALETFLTPPAPVISTPPAPVISTPPARQPRWRSSLRFVAVLSVLLFMLVFLLRFKPDLPVMANFPAPAPTDTILPAGAINNCATDSSEQTAQSFVETFQDNRRGWQQNNWESITPTIANNTYTLHIGNSKQIYFLCPDAKTTGVLPEKFSLTAQIMQTQGGTASFYGLGFHLGYQQDTNQPSGYAFVINGNGICALIKYTPRNAQNYSVLKSQHCPSVLHSAPDSNTLQVIAQGSQFTFKINDTLVPFAGANETNQSVVDQTYVGGQLGLLVSGPDTTFVVKSIKLTL